MTTIYSALYQDFAHLDAFSNNLKIARHPDDLKEPGILILHGGADISPSIYGHAVSRRTHADEQPSARDIAEIRLARRAMELGISIYGICRGAQLSCALAGGSLVQHVNGHVGSPHPVITTEGEVLRTSTCHHQMMNPFSIDHELLAWTADPLSDCYIVEHEQDLPLTIEPEVVYYPKIKALGIQGHPEWMDKASPFVQYCLRLVKERLL